MSGMNGNRATSRAVARDDNNNNNNNNNNNERNAVAAPNSTSAGGAGTATSISIGMTIRGRASRKSTIASSFCNRRVLCTIVWVCLVLLVYQLLWQYWFAGMFIPDVEIDKQTGQVRTRRRPDRTHKLDLSTHVEIHNEPIDGVMEGHLTLIDIQLPKIGGLVYNSEDQPYSGVQATFCHISWPQQFDTPHAVPTFVDLKKNSPLCKGTILRVPDFHEVVVKTKLYDARNHWNHFTATTPDKRQAPVEPTAVIFHQSRSGSTAMANTLAAFAPKQTRVYSEAPPPVIALKACELLSNQHGPGAGDTTTAFGVTCDSQAHMALIQDVFYIMGRITRPKWPQYVFYKLQSITIQDIEAFVAAMPETPWIFLYRNPVEILMSHFQHYLKSQTSDTSTLRLEKLPRGFTPACLQNYKQPHQPELLTDVVAASTNGQRSVQDLSKEEYCAAHLATLAEAAIREHEKESLHHLSDTTSTAPHWFINYNELPFVIWETILPTIIRLKNHATVLGRTELDRMHHASKIYAKSRNKEDTDHWIDDSKMKQNLAPTVIQQAARTFMEPTYDKLELIRSNQKQ